MLSATIDRIGPRIDTLDEGGFADADRWVASLVLGQEMRASAEAVTGIPEQHSGDMDRAPVAPEPAYAPFVDRLGHLADDLIQHPGYL